MKYSKAIQREIDALGQYTISENMTSFEILHLYPQGLAGKQGGARSGFIDSRWFELWGFSIHTNNKRNLGIHDGLRFDKGVDVDIVRIFADGSTLIRFKHSVEVDNFTEAIVRREE